MARSLFGRLREATSATALPALARDTDAAEMDAMNGDGGSDSVEVQDCPNGGCNDGLLDDGTPCPTCDGAGWTATREAELTAAARKRIPKSDFAVPSLAPGSGSYPIADRAHAINALARASGKPEEDTVKRAVYAKYPDLKPSATKESEIADAHERMIELFDQLERLREGAPVGLDRQDATLPTVKTKDGRDGYQVVLIREGNGNSVDKNWYTAQSIRELVESGRAEGMQAYANHPPLDQEETLPERDVKEIVGTYHDVTLAESGGRAQANAILVPIKGDGYNWVQTLAEAAATHTGPKPLCGISLYGQSVGSFGDRPDGSWGRMVEQVHPTSADIVTNAGAGGEFVRRLIESARQRRRAGSQPRKDETPMTLDELKAKIGEAAQRVREADTPEKVTAAATELVELQQAEVEAPAAAPVTLDGLAESQPALLEQLRESAKADVSTEVTELQGKLRESQKRDAEIAATLETIGALREREITDSAEVAWYTEEVRLRGLREADAIKSFIDSQIAREKRTRESVLSAVGVEGNGGRTPGAEESADKGLAKLREAGIPIVKEPVAA